MQQLFVFPTNRKVLGNRKVEISLVVMSPAFSAAPTGVVVSLATVGNNRFTKVSASTRTNLQQVPSDFNEKAYLPLGICMVRPALTLGFNNVCQSDFALWMYSAR